MNTPGNARAASNNEDADHTSVEAPTVASATREIKAFFVAFRNSELILEIPDFTAFRSRAKAAPAPADTAPVQAPAPVQAAAPTPVVLPAVAVEVAPAPRPVPAAPVPVAPMLAPKPQPVVEISRLDVPEVAKAPVVKAPIVTPTPAPPALPRLEAVPAPVVTKTIAPKVAATEPVHTMPPVVSAPLSDPLPSVAARVFTSRAGLVKPRETTQRSTESRVVEWTARREERGLSMPLPGARRSGSMGDSGTSILHISGRCLTPPGGGRVVLQEVVSSAQGGSAHNNTILVLERVVIPAPLHYSEGPASGQAEKFVEVSYSRQEGLPGESSSPFLGAMPVTYQKPRRYSHVTILPDGITIPIQ